MGDLREPDAHGGEHRHDHDHHHEGHDHAVSDCERALAELHRFLDRELTDDDRVVIEGHLHDCTDCLGAFDFHAELKAVIATKCHNDQLPPGLLDRLDACLQEASASDAVEES